jgi:hypothetical protein
MQADALRPLNSDLNEDGPKESLHIKEVFTPETIEEATYFLRLDVCDTSRGTLDILKHYIGPRQIAARTCISPRPVCVLFLVWDAIRRPR